MRLADVARHQLSPRPTIRYSASAFRSSHDDDSQRFEVMYLTADLKTISGTMKSAAQTGVCSLLIFRNIFGNRFDLLGITESLLELQTRL